MFSDNLRGDLCDYFVKKALAGHKLVSPYSAGLLDAFPISIQQEKNGKGFSCTPRAPTPMAEYKKRLEDNFGSSNLPAYLVRGKKVFIEVKLDEKPTLEPEKAEEFKKILKKGYNVFIVVPKVEMGEKSIGLKELKCFEFLEDGELAENSIKEILKAISEAHA